MIYKRPKLNSLVIFTNCGFELAWYNKNCYRRGFLCVYLYATNSNENILDLLFSWHRGCYYDHAVFKTSTYWIFENIVWYLFFFVLKPTKTVNFDLMLTLSKHIALIFSSYLIWTSLQVLHHLRMLLLPVFKEMN